MKTGLKIVPGKLVNAKTMRNLSFRDFAIFSFVLQFFQIIFELFSTNFKLIYKIIFWRHIIIFCKSRSISVWIPSSFENWRFRILRHHYSKNKYPKTISFYCPLCFYTFLWKILLPCPFNASSAYFMPVSF